MDFPDFNSWVDRMHKDNSSVKEFGRKITSSKSPVVMALENFQLSAAAYLGEINTNKEQQNNATIISLMSNMGQEVSNDSVTRAKIYEEDLLGIFSTIRLVNEKVNASKIDYIGALGLNKKKNPSEYLDKEFILVK